VLGESKGVGLGSGLRVEAATRDTVLAILIRSVDFLVARAGTSESGEMTGSLRFGEALSWAKEAYHILLVDAMLLYLVWDNLLFAKWADLTNQVPHERQAGRPAVQLEPRPLDSMRGNCAGVVVNCAKPRTWNCGSFYSTHCSQTVAG
jgi:hypothetical protein